MIRFKGHWDGKGIVPDEPVEIPNGQPLQITVEDAGDTVWQRIARLARDMPGDLPRDLAAQHDHYLHGRPKR
ncbi:MAG: hypothetical protein V3W34_16370 [Phycisphaerae bacterium]